MAKEDRFYYTKPVIESITFGKRHPQILKDNPNYLIEVEEDVDFRQVIGLTICKHKQSNFPKLASTEYDKVTPVIKEIFLKHYNLALKFIHEINISDGEFYIYPRSKDWWQLCYFSNDLKNKWNIEIDFRDSMDDLWLIIYSRPGHSGRPGFRKNGTPIEAVVFKQFLNLTIQYLSDSESLLILLEDYIRNFRLLASGNERIEGLIISTSKSFEEILNQLDLRKQSLEKRLIENDSDSTIERAKLRGELDGIGYSIKTILSFK